MLRSHQVWILLMAVVYSTSASERWVWGSQRSGRQIDPSERPSSLPPRPPRAPAGGSSLLAPSASSLHPLRRPAALSSSFSVAAARPLASSPRALPLSQTQEPLQFRPLSIDISKLPLETSDPSDSLVGLGHVPHVSLVQSGDELAQDLSEDGSRSGPGQQTPIVGFIKTHLTQSISDLKRGTTLPLRQAQASHAEALVATPDISQLPLQSSPSSSSFTRGVNDDQVTFPVSLGLQEFQRPSSTAAAAATAAAAGLRGSVASPQTVVVVEERQTSDTRSGRLQPEPLRQQQQPPASPPPLSATPVPTRIFLQDIPVLDSSPFLGDKILEGEQILKALEALQRQDTKDFEPAFQKLEQIAEENNDILTSFSNAVVTPKEIVNFSFAVSKSPIKIVEAPQFGVPPRTSDSSSSFIFPTPLTRPSKDTQPRPTSQVASSVRPNRSTLSKRPEPNEIRSLSLFFKKPSGLKKDRGIPSYVWLWPGESRESRLSELFTRPATHAL